MRVIYALHVNNHRLDGRLSWPITLNRCELRIRPVRLISLSGTLVSARAHGRRRWLPFREVSRLGKLEMIRLTLALPGSHHCLLEIC
jgi:hypothetical protein